MSTTRHHQSPASGDSEIRKAAIRTTLVSAVAGVMILSGLTLVARSGVLGPALHSALNSVLPVAAAASSDPLAPAATTSSSAPAVVVVQASVLSVPDPVDATSATTAPLPTTTPTTAPTSTSAPATTAAPTTAAAPTTTTPVVVAAAEHVERGKAALAQITYPWQQRLPGWTVEFLPERDGYYGLTMVTERRIEIYVRSDQSDSLLAHVIAHEIGHAVDVTLNSATERERWQEARGITDAPWWPSAAATDFSTGAGDFAECFAAWQTGGSAFRSRLGPAPDADQLSLMAELAAA